MTAARTTDKKSNMPVPGSVSNATDHELKQGLEYIKKGDAYRDSGKFDRAKEKYEKAARFCPIEAREQLEILPLFKLSKTSVEDSAPDRYISVEIHAHSHHATKKFKQMWSKPSSTPSLQQTFFPGPASSSQLTVPSLGISSSQSTSMSISTCTNASTPTNRFTMGTPLTLASQTLVSDFGTVSDVRSLAASYKTADDGARTIIQQRIYDIIKEFGQHQVTFDTVQELVVLAEIQVRDIFLHIVTEILCVLREKSLLSGIALQGLAVILDLFPDEIDMSSVQGAFAEILASLQNRLRVIRTVNNDLELLPLMSALNALLDTMVRRKVFGLERQAVYNDLRTLLTRLASHSTVMVCFQALYAKQALAIIGNDESLPMSVFRRGKLAFVLAGNVSNMATRLDLASAESAYQNIKEFFDFSVQDRWYQGLIYVDYLVGQRSWSQLEDFVLRSKFHSDICFLLGVILRLEQIAVVQEDVAVRDGAVKLLIFLEESDMRLVPEMAQSTSRRLEKRKSSAGSLNDDLRPVWDPAWLAAPKGTLFKAVQDTYDRNATVDGLPARLDSIEQAVGSHHSTVAQPSLEDVRSALKAYYTRDLAILRVSGDKLPLETCFVNLAIVEAPAQRKKDKEDLKELAAVFHRIPSVEAVGGVNMQKPIPLEEIFDKRKLRDGKEGIPKTILVQGRAGVGKTTLCKKLVHVHQTGLWRDRFDTVLWLPLRQIKAFKARTLEGLFREKFFTQGLDQDDAALAHELAASAQVGRVLFVLDGLDEIAKDTRGDDDVPLRQFLRILLSQQHVVITTRPSGLDRSLLPPSIDLELETIGFNQQNVNDFVSKVLSPEAAETVQRFIRQTPLIQGLVNIPVQLDVICYSWDSLPTEGLEITMTGLYQLMVQKLWCKDAVLLGKTAGGKILTQDQIHQLSPLNIDRLVATELQHLGYLAFRGMANDHQIEFDAKALLGAFEDLQEYHVSDKTGLLPPQLVEIMKQTSFLHTADANLDAGKNDSQQAWYFLHLTFQEYFAATWVAQHLQQPIPVGMQEYFASTRSTHDRQQPLPVGMMTVEQARAFVQEHKYNPRYEIMWWMVAGLLEGQALENFFHLLQGNPRDLIGGRHQLILASCLNEARARLHPMVVTRLETELENWLGLEYQICLGDNFAASLLGSQSSFPEAILVKTMSMRSYAKAMMVHTLEARSTLSESVIQILIDALKDNNTNIRYSAASTLGKQTTLSETAIHSLIGAIKDKHVRHAAEVSLCKQFTLSEEAIQALIGALKDEEFLVRCSAESVLGKRSWLSETAIQSLIGVLKDEKSHARKGAAKVLGKQSVLPQAAIQSLLDSVKDEDVDVRRSAQTALTEQITLSEAAIETLIDALKNENAEVCYSARIVLYSQSMLSQAAIQSLIDVGRHDKANVRSRALSLLGEQSRLSEVAIQFLIGALKDKDANVRSSVVSALGKQSTLSEAAIQSLVGALMNGDENIRSSAASALGKQSTPSEAVIQSLISALKDEKEVVRSSAALALGNQSTLSEAAIQSLVSALKDEKEVVRSSAASALGNQSTLSQAAFQSLMVALEDRGEDTRVRSSAASALGRHPILSEAAIQSLIVALEDWNGCVASSAASALGNQTTLPEAAIQTLIGALGNEDAVVAYAAAEALGKLSTLSEAVIQSLIGVLTHEDERIRKSAEGTLRNQSTFSEAAMLSLVAALEHVYRDYDFSPEEHSIIKQSTLSEEAIQPLIGALKDAGPHVRAEAAWILGNQSTLSEASALSLSDALEDTDADVRQGAIWALSNHSTLPETVIHNLIGILQDEVGTNDHYGLFRPAAAAAMCSQSTLSETAIHSIIDTFKTGSAYIRECVAEIFDIHCQSLCMAIPGLSEAEIVLVYRNHLFRYSCQHVMSLQVQDNRLCFYTEQGLSRTGPLDVKKIAYITSAFEAAKQFQLTSQAHQPQRDAGGLIQMTAGSALSIAASIQDPAHAIPLNAGTPQQESAGNPMRTSGAPVAAPGHNIPNALLTAAFATVRAMVESIQSNRIAPSSLVELSLEQRQAVKEQVIRMMPMFLALEELMPVFYALTNDRNATERLIIMKIMFRYQLDDLMLERYTITPENLSKWQEQLQHFFLWVEAELNIRAAACNGGGLHH